ncbi:MAG: ATP-binding SpoIIE family protein phosphatase [Thermodesulfobacteriota bacterium]|nr:ATP-binding SpoIIE family protein phosphatase [Thermodesulfobacteriota bacterium]
MEETLRIRIDDPSLIGESRRLVLPMCKILGFSEPDTSRILLVVTEMATNLSKHTPKGELLIRSLECFGIHGLDILSIDKGPGITDVARGLQDGFSTAGSPGTGLGAIYRNSSEFDIYSENGKGTVVMSRHWSGTFREGLPPRPLEFGGICIPIKGEHICGDGWDAEQSEQRSLILVADGTGHGVAAAEASRAAISLFRKNISKSPAGLIKQIHEGLRNTRGAAVSIAEVDHANSIVRYAGIGNIAGLIVTSKIAKNTVSHNGIAGLNARKIQEFSYPWNDKSILIMNSDGIRSHLNLADHPLLANRHPSVIAAVLFRDYARGNDDTTVVVAKKQHRAPPFKWISRIL